MEHYEDDGLDYEVDYMADIDDQYAHYFTPYQIADRMDYEPKSEGDYRFFEPGNHFSDNIYIAKCTANEVEEHLEMFTTYLTCLLYTSDAADE